MLHHTVRCQSFIYFVLLKLTDQSLTNQVRAAAVMALGTFINSCKTRREHENTLDQNIAIRLVQNNLEDGSPLVSAGRMRRREKLFLS